ncbi:MAG TPA: transporter substrate-binding domain-containing protein [Candidatus Nitrosotenuis sp.]|nr:transporter substrate-binding domain-containing protein [Candidatus Nitrosotenuis sp.]
MIWLQIIASPATEHDPPEKEVLLNGWYLWDPYQYQTNIDGIEVLTGLDIELVRYITKAAGKKVKYEPVSWKQHQLDLKEGKRDFAAGATYTEERAKYYHYSIPYREEENSLFVPRGQEDRLQFNNVDEFLEQLAPNQFRVGIIDGFIYASPKINAWIADPKNQQLIHRAHDDLENIELLLQGKIDGFLADRIVGATLVWRERAGDKIAERRLGVKTPIHLIFSKKTVSSKLVDMFNEAIVKLKASEDYTKIISWYWHPILLMQTIDAYWFKIIEYLGIVAFAISGLVIAYRDQSTLFGAFIFALMPSIGGGIIRDVIFGRKPVGAMQSPSYLLLVLATVLFGLFIIKAIQYLKRYFAIEVLPDSIAKNRNISNHILMVCDGLGLAAFTVSGIIVSLMAKAHPLWLWGPFFAFLTGAGGGILRDLLSKERRIVSIDGDIYPEIAVLWGFFLSIFLTFQAYTATPESIRSAVIITVLGAFICRVYAYIYNVSNIRFHIHSLQKPPPQIR